MTPLRNALRMLVLPFLLTSALSASTDFRILFDTDNNPATGCTVSGMNGVERVVTTTLDTSGSTPRVSSVQSQVCSGGSLGGVVALETLGWPAGFDATTGVYTVETRVLYSIFGDPVPTHMRLGFVAVSGSQSATVLTDDDSNPFLFPQTPVRRRAVGTPGHTFVLDGLEGDWMAMPPLAFGDFDNGPNLARFLGIFAASGADGFYFRFDFQSHSGAPTARNDSYSTPAATPLSVTAPGVMSNDTDPNNRALTAALISSVTRGALVLNSDGSFTYTPADGGTFRDTFRYRVSNGSQPSNVARVEIHVGRSNHPPNAGDDTYNVVRGGSIIAAAPGVLGNDNDPDGDALHAVLRSSPSHGTLTFNSDGSFTYFNDGLSTTDDSFTYVANDGQDDSREATVHINVTTNPNAPPHANADAYSVNEGGTLTVPAPGVLTNDTDPDTPAGSLSAFVVTTPAHGALTLSSNGGFVYIHDGSETTSDSFTYRAFDGATPSNIATVTITITPVNDAPVASNDTYTTAEDTPLTVPAATGVLANDTDSDTPHAALIATMITNAANGNVVLSASGSFTYTPNANFFGTDSFTYTASDGSLSSAPATVTITVTPVNDPPSFTVGGNVTVLEDSGAYSAAQATAISPGPGETEAVSFGVTNNNNALFSAQPAISPTGVLTFTPAPNANGSATVSVALNDAGTPPLSSAPQTFTITVTPVNDVPSFTKGPDELVLDTAGAQTFAGWALNLSAGPPDEAAQLLNFIVTNDNNALFSVQPSIASNGTLTFTPAVGQAGVANVTVQIHDNGGTANGGVDTSVAQTFKITINQAPAITSGNAHTFIIGVPSSFTVTTTGFPTPGVSESGALPTGISFVDNGNGTATLSGTAAAGTGGTYPITITASNGAGAPATQPFTITVSCPTITITNPATNTAPAASPFSQTFTQSGGVGATTFTTASTLPAGLTLATNGTLSGTPTQTGTFPITVTATDSNGCTGTGSTYTLVITCQTITVTNPAVTTGTISAPFSQTFTQTGAIGATTFTTLSTLPTGLTLATNGTLSGTPTQTGTFPITVTVTDFNGCTGTGPAYNLVIGCQTITVTNPATTSGTAGTPFSDTFAQSGAIGAATFTTASPLPAGMTLAANGVLSGTPTTTGTFPITVTVTDSNGCAGTSAGYTLVIGCQIIIVTSPATSTGTAGAPFSQTFTQSGAIGGATFTTSNTLPAGLTLSTAGVLSGTPTQTGSFDINVTVTDGNGCTGTSSGYTLVIGCQTITVTAPAINTGTANTPFSQTFTQSGAIGGATFTTGNTLPLGLTLATNGTLSGTPLQTGSADINVTVTDGNGCSGIVNGYTLTIGCQTITVNNPATTTATAQSPFSQSFTATNTIGLTTFTTASTLPNGLTLASDGTLSGTPTETGTFPIVVTATDGNGCSGTGATYTLVVGCQTITVTNPANANGTVSTPFSEQFTESGAFGSATFTTASTLPAGLTLSTAGLLSGTPTQIGTFPITVTVTDANGCTGTSAVYNLVIGCQTITVTNPANATGPAGTPFNETFTQTGAIGTATFTTVSTLPTGLTLSTAGVLSGTPTQGGTFPITVTVTDSNGCTGDGPIYNLVITCPVITVTNPATTTGTVGAPFSEVFTQLGGQGTVTFTTSSALPGGLTLATNGTLSGTPSQFGTFPIVVTATDQNGCIGTGPTYNLVISCPTITVTNPATTTGTAGTAFSETFTQSGAFGTGTFSTSSTLPTGLTLSTAGVLSGTPTVVGTFPIVVTVIDSAGCTGTGATYTLVIGCQTITVTSPVVNTGTVDAPFSQTFTQTGAIGTATFTTASTLPAGLVLASNGTLAGTPTVTGTFPIVVTVTDSNGCTGTSATYTLLINCQTITVTNPANATGTVNVAFSEQFTQTGAHGTVTFTTASTLPTGFTLATDGTLSGTTMQHTTFPIVVTVTDSNGCTGTSATYNLVINCQTITVTNPGVNTGTVGSPFSEQFTESGSIGGATFSTLSTLPTGLTLDSAGLLAGTPTQSGSFPIVVTVTDGNGCTGTNPAYTLIIACNVITVTNPVNSTGTANSAFSALFTQTGGNGTVNFTTSSTLPTGLSLALDGTLSGTPLQTGTFPIVVTATDVNGCTGTSPTYNLTINCQVITVNNPVTNTGTRGTAFSQTFTASNTIGATTFSTVSALPPGLTLSTGGVLSGTPTQHGVFNIIVSATDSNGCNNNNATYQLTINCQVITVNNPGVSTGTFNVPFSQTFTQTGAIGGATFTTSSTLPTGLSLSTAGVLSGTPTQTGTFPIVVTVTDGDTPTGCTGTSATYNLAINPVANGDSYTNVVDNTQAVVIGGATTPPSTPFVSFAFTGRLIANDTPSGGVTANSGPFATTAGGSVTIQADGTFIYTPKVNPGAAITTADSFTYTISSNTGGTATATTANATASLTLANRVWYVKNDGGAGNGQSQSPFNTLAAAETASIGSAGPNVDHIFVYFGNGTNSGQNVGIALKNGQQLIGEAVGLTVNAQLLVTAVPANRPIIGNPGAGASGVTVDGSAGPMSNVFIKGVSVSGNAQGINILSGAANTLTATVDNVIVSNATVNNGIRIAGGSTGTTTVTVQNSAVSAATQNGIDARQTVAGNLRLDINTTTITAKGIGMVIDGSVAGNTTITGFANNTIGPNTVSIGMSITSATFDVTPGGTFQTVSGGNTLIGTPGDGVGGAGMVMTNVAGDLSFTDLDIRADGGAGLSANGLAAYTGSAGFQIAVSNANVATIAATGGPAVNLTTVTANLPFNTISSNTSSTTGVSLVTVPGTFSAGSGSSITTATGTDFSINGSNATVTYDGTITADVGTLVNITNTTGGAKTFSGAITDGDDGDGSGVSITANNAATTITFRGGLVLSTGASNAFTAIGAGTLNVCDENPCNPAATGVLINKITTTTGTALNVVNTTIGANNLEFRSISAGTAASGPANGIVLNTTGSSGGLKVKGTGVASSGGTIQKTTSFGVVLTSTENVEFNRFSIHDTGDRGINGSGVNNFIYRDSTVFNFDNGTHGAGLTVDAMTFTNLTGTVTIQRSTLGPDGQFVLSPFPPLPENKGIIVRNTNVANLNMTVTGTTFTQLSNDGIDAEVTGGTGTISVDGSTGDGANVFNQINGRSVNFGAPVDNSSARVLDLTVKNNSFTSVGIGGRWFAPARTTMNARFNNNTMSGTSNDAIRSEADAADGTLSPKATVNATINGNNMGGGGIFISNHRQAIANIALTNNPGIGFFGINVNSDRGSTIGIDITGNSVSVNGASPNFANAMYLQTSNNGGGASTTCANIIGNVLTSTGATSAGVVLDTVAGEGTISLEGYVSGPEETYLTSVNTIAGSPQVAIDDPTFVNPGGNCVTSTP